MVLAIGPVVVNLRTQRPVLIAVATLADHVTVWHIVIRRSLDRGAIVVCQAHQITVGTIDSLVDGVALGPVAAELGRQSLPDVRSEIAAEAGAERMGGVVTLVRVADGIISGLFQSAVFGIQLFRSVTDGAQLGEFAVVVLQSVVGFVITGEVGV